MSNLSSNFKLWKPKIGDKVISNHAFKREFCYEIRGTIKGLMMVGKTRNRHQVLYFKEPLFSWDIGWFRFGGKS